MAAVVSELRKEKSENLTQEAVMNEIKISSGISLHVGRIETAVNNITVSNLSLLCDYYNIPLSSFHARVEEKLKSK